MKYLVYACTSIYAGRTKHRVAREWGTIPSIPSLLAPRECSRGDGRAIKRRGGP